MQRYNISMAKRKLPQVVFQQAFYGYLNLAEHGKITNRRYLTICDFSLSSNENRLWVVDIPNKKVVINTMVAHGAATGEEYARQFSNIPESHQSSLGFFVTKQTYSGAHGYSLRLAGVDGHFNNNAESRDIVIHGADYVSKEFAGAHKRIGRSWGCPAVNTKIAKPLIDRVKNGSCLFISHTTPAYSKSSYWLNQRLARVPMDMKVEPADETADITTESNETDTKDADAPSTLSQLGQAEQQDYLLTVTEYQDPEEIAKLVNDPSNNVETFTIPQSEVTDEIRAKVLKKKKVVRNISNIIYVSGKNDAATNN